MELETRTIWKQSKKREGEREREKQARKRQDEELQAWFLHVKLCVLAELQAKASACIELHIPLAQEDLICSTAPSALRASFSQH